MLYGDFIIANPSQNSSIPAMIEFNWIGSGTQHLEVKVNRNNLNCCRSYKIKTIVVSDVALSAGSIPILTKGKKFLTCDPKYDYKKCKNITITPPVTCKCEDNEHLIEYKDNGKIDVVFTPMVINAENPSDSRSDTGMVQVKDFN